MLVLSRRRDESIVIGDNVVVTIVDIRGDKVRLGITAPTEVPVHRQEVYDAIQREQDEHPAVLVILNGKKILAPKRLTYEEIVGLAGMSGQPSVTFSRAKPCEGAACRGGDGILAPGGCLEPLRGCVISAAHTNNA